MSDYNRTIWCGNLPDQITEELLYELFLQAGPLESVRLPKDNKTKRHKNFAFITYVHDVSVPYAINLFRGTALFNQKMTMYCRGAAGLLPPPIRSCGPEASLNFPNVPNLVQHFVNMAENFREKEQVNPIHEQRRREADNRLVIDSLQGNWTHRHHPYRAKEHPHNRDHNNHRGRAKPSGGWRDRRYNKKSQHHRRD